MKRVSKPSLKVRENIETNKIVPKKQATKKQAPQRTLDLTKSKVDDDLEVDIYDPHNA